MGKLSVTANIAEIAMLLVLLLCVLQTSEAAKKKTTQLHFYFHDRLAGTNATAVSVASATTTSSSATGFGGVVVVDDLLTEGPESNSTLLGKAQGLYAAVGQEQHVLLMVLTFKFETGKYNGSTLIMVGNDPIFDDIREMPIVGGSGKFRMARGYALAHTVALTPGNATVEHNVTVYHY